MAQSRDLHRALGLWAVTFYCFGDILGAGIYALVGEVAAVSGSATPLAFALALIVASLTALGYAELGSRHPRAGVEVFFTRRVFGSHRAALLVGWMVLCSAVVSAATVSHAFAGYLRQLVPGVPTWILVVAFLGIAAGINFWGIEASSRANIFATVVEASGLLVVVAVGLAFVFSSDAAAMTTVESRAAADPQWLAVTRGAALAFFAFIGFEDVVNVAEEVIDPERNFPRGILIALAMAGVLYVGVAWVALQVLTAGELAASSAPLVTVVEEAAPAIPAWLFVAIGLFAVSNTGLLNSITASRLVYGMSKQGLLPTGLAEVHDRQRTPYRSIVVVLLLSLALALSGSLAFLAGTTSVLLLIVFSVINLALVLIKLKERRSAASTDTAGAFRIPLVVPLLAIASGLVLILGVPRGSLLRAGVLIAVGAVAVFLHSRRRGRGDGEVPHRRR